MKPDQQPHKRPADVCCRLEVPFLQLHPTALANLKNALSSISTLSKKCVNRGVSVVKKAPVFNETQTSSVLTEIANNPETSVYVIPRYLLTAILIFTYPHKAMPSKLSSCRRRLTKEPRFRSREICVRPESTKL